MTIKCEGCGRELDNYNPLTKKWDEVATERPHVCPNPEKLKEALKAKRASKRMTDPNAHKYVKDIKECGKCHAKFSVKLEKCPNCKQQFIRSLFEKKHY